VGTCGVVECFLVVFTCCCVVSTPYEYIHLIVRQSSYIYIHTPAVVW
jgi:hypothetical protein